MIAACMQLAKRLESALFSGSGMQGASPANFVFKHLKSITHQLVSVRECFLRNLGSQVVVEQALALAAVQEARQAEAAAGALARASRAEERMRAHLEALRMEKETIVANRVQREKELAEEREREWQAALERDRQQGRENRVSF